MNTTLAPRSLSAGSPWFLLAVPSRARLPSSCPRSHLLPPVALQLLTLDFQVSFLANLSRTKIIFRQAGVHPSMTEEDLWDLEGPVRLSGHF